jgi:hypothetical protein
MTGLFKFQRLGKVSSFANQYIETSFLLFLIPIKSYFVNLNTKKTIEIPLNKISLKNYYISFLFVITPILLFVLAIWFPTDTHIHLNENLIYLPAIILGCFIITGIVLGYTIGKPGKYEIAKRTIFQSTININALPEWLSDDSVRTIYSNFNFNLQQGWMDKIKRNEYTSDEFFFYYTILSYKNKISPAEETIHLWTLLDEKLKN